MFAAFLGLIGVLANIVTEVAKKLFLLGVGVFLIILAASTTVVLVLAYMLK